MAVADFTSGDIDKAKIGFEAISRIQKANPDIQMNIKPWLELLDASISDEEDSELS